MKNRFKTGAQFVCSANCPESKIEIQKSKIVWSNPVKASQPNPTTPPPHGKKPVKKQSSFWLFLITDRNILNYIHVQFRFLKASKGC